MLSRQIAAGWDSFGIRSNCIMLCFVKMTLSIPFYADKVVEEGRTRMIASRHIGETIDIPNVVI